MKDANTVARSKNTKMSRSGGWESRRRVGFPSAPKRSIYNCECGETAVFIMAIRMVSMPDWMPLCRRCLAYEMQSPRMSYNYYRLPLCRCGCGRYVESKGDIATAGCFARLDWKRFERTAHSLKMPRSGGKNRFNAFGDLG